MKCVFRFGGILLKGLARPSDLFVPRSGGAQEFAKSKRDLGGLPGIQPRSFKARETTNRFLVPTLVEVETRQSETACRSPGWARKTAESLRSRGALSCMRL